MCFKKKEKQIVLKKSFLEYLKEMNAELYACSWVFAIQRANQINEEINKKFCKLGITNDREQMKIRELAVDSEYDKIEQMGYIVK